MGSNGSFYQNGLPLSTAETGLGNVPAALPAPKTAESSFYLSGTAYIESDPILAAASAVSAAASAAAAAASLATLNTTALLKANNLSDLTNAATARTNIGLGNVDNTSDVNKPVSTAQAAADALKVNIASPTLTGVPAAPTATPGTNTTQLATTAFVDAARAILAAATALKADIASPALTGTPTAPTAAAATNTTQLATTAFVEAARVILAAADALKADIASPTLTGTPAAPTAAVDTNTTQLATTAFVLAQAGSATPLIDATTAVVGTSTRFARQDHVHPTDTTRAALASPALTGTPTAPTATVGTNTTQLATTAFVLANAAAGSANGIVSVVSYTTTQTITIPTGATRASIRFWAPGGGSGSATSGAQGSAGGGSGSYLEKYLTGLTPGNTLALTIGSVGAGGVAGAGGTGGATSLASGTQTISTLTVNGGVGSVIGSGSKTAGGGGGAISTGGDINVAGRSGQETIVGNTGTTVLAGNGGVPPGGAIGGAGGKGISGAVNGNAGEAGGMVVEWLS